MTQTGFNGIVHADNTRSLTREMKKLLGTERKDGKTYRQVLAKVMLLKALQGNTALMLHIWDRDDGKVPDRIAGPDGGAVAVDVMFEALARIYPKEELAPLQAQIMPQDSLEYESQQEISEVIKEEAKDGGDSDRLVGYPRETSESD